MSRHRENTSAHSNDPERDSDGWPDLPQPEYDTEELRPNPDEFDDPILAANSVYLPDFDPMNAPTWTWFMVIGWICWRNPFDVQMCWDHFRTRYAWYLPNISREVKTVEGLEGAKVLVKYERRTLEPVCRALLDAKASSSVNRMKMPMRTAEDKLKCALISGKLVAVAADSISGHAVKISAFEWVQIEVDEKGELQFGKGNPTSYQNVRFARSEVVRLWPADECSADQNFLANSDTNKGGRPAEYNWDQMKEAAREMVEANGIPGPTNRKFPSKAQLVEAIMSLFASKYDQHPSESTVRARMNDWLKEFTQR